MSENETENLTSEVAEWFFEDYLPSWVGVGNQGIDNGPGFILDYWGVPLYYYNTDGGQWASTATASSPCSTQPTPA